MKQRQIDRSSLSLVSCFFQFSDNKKKKIRNSITFSSNCNILLLSLLYLTIHNSRLRSLCIFIFLFLSCSLKMIVAFHVVNYFRCRLLFADNLRKDNNSTNGHFHIWNENVYIRKKEKKISCTRLKVKSRAKTESTPSINCKKKKMKMPTVWPARKTILPNKTLTYTEPFMVIIIVIAIVIAFYCDYNSIQQQKKKI